MALTEYPRVGQYRDDELVYAATARCPCGAGLAYPPDDATPGSYWDCADILTGRAVQHTAMKSFTFWEIKSEIQPSAHGMTTRPASEPLPMTVCYKD